MPRRTQILLPEIARPKAFKKQPTRIWESSLGSCLGISRPDSSSQGSLSQSGLFLLDIKNRISYCTSNRPAAARDKLNAHELFRSDIQNRLPTQTRSARNPAGWHLFHASPQRSQKREVSGHTCPCHRWMAGAQHQSFSVSGCVVKMGSCCLQKCTGLVLSDQKNWCLVEFDSIFG